MNLMLKAMMVKMGLKESEFALYNEVETATWRDSHGRVLSPNEFDDSHLLNTIGFLVERAARLDRAKEIIKAIASEGIFPVTVREESKVTELQKDPVFIALILEANNRGLM